MNPANIIPHSAESEQSILGSILIDKNSINGIVEIVKPEHFYDRGHQAIYSSMLEMIGSKKPIDLITLSEYLERKNLLDDAGGFVYLGDIAKNTPSSANCIAYCEVVIERWNGRQILSACNQGIDAVREGRDYKEARKSVYDALEGLFQTKGEHVISDANDLCQSFTDELERLMEFGGKLAGWSTGDIHLDEATGGLKPGDYLGIAARPGGGKTTKALNIVTEFVCKKRRVLCFSMEMKKQIWMMKLFSDMANILFDHLKKGKLSDDEWGRLSNAMAKVKDSKLHIDDSSGLTIDDIERKARQLKAKYGSLDLIVIDYWQRIKLVTTNHYQERTDISRRLKDLFMELDCAGIVMAQLKKNSIGFPNASDIKESAAFEEDSDVLIFLHTPSDDLKPHKGVLTLEIFNKVRLGEATVKCLRNELEFQRFSCSNDTYQEPETKRF